MNVFRKVYDPYKTVRRVSYKQAKAEHKRREERTVKFMMFLFWGYVAAVTITLVVGSLVRLAR